MREAVLRRAGHFHVIVLRPVWAWLVTGLLGLVSLLAFVRDEFLSPAVAERFRFLRWAPMWPWYCWALAFAAAILAVVFEGSFRAAEGQRARILELEEARKPRIRLSFGSVSAGILRTPIQTITKLTLPPTPAAGANVPGNPGQNLNLVREHMASCVRVQVEALSSTAVAGCMGYVVGLERWSNDGSFSPIMLPHGIKLYETPRTVRPGVPSSIDFLVCDEITNKMTVPAEWPLALSNVFDEPTIYRFKIVVGNDDFSTSICVQIDWQGQWDTVSGEQVSD
jgi:hypothetical protein